MAMNELQRVECDMLRELIAVCERLELRYFLVCGTALGAVKYHGFIPWDDDVDIALPRADYEVLCERAQALLPAHLFLQNHRTDPRYPLIFSKLRNRDTTFIESSLAEIPMNHGVYIDIFPLDGYPTDKKAAARLEKAKYRYALWLFGCTNTPRSKKARLLSGVERLLGLHKHPAHFIERLEGKLKTENADAAPLWCNHGNWQGKLEYAPREQYGEGTWATFEGLRVRIPERYDEYLTQKYGDWRADPPADEQVGHHYHTVCDLTRPYTEHIEHLPGGKLRIK